MVRKRIVVLDPSSPASPEEAMVFFNQDPNTQNSWVHEQTLPGSVENLAFKDGKTLMIADKWASVGGNYFAGLVRVYERTGSTWSRVQTIQAPTPAIGELFGTDLDYEGSTMIIGANDEDTGLIADAGAVHAYQKDATGTWVHRGYVHAPEGQDFDGFGDAVAMQGTLAIAGAPNRDRGGAFPAQSIGGLYALELAPAIASQETPLLGSPPNPAALLAGTTSGPVVGAVWDPVIDHTSFYPGATADWLVVSPQPSVNVPIAGGTLLCPLVGAKLSTTTPGTAFQLSIPPDCSLIGRTGCAQGASLGPSGLQLTNGFDLVLGSY